MGCRLQHGRIPRRSMSSIPFAVILSRSPEFPRNDVPDCQSPGADRFGLRSPWDDMMRVREDFSIL